MTYHRPERWQGRRRSPFPLAAGDLCRNAPPEAARMGQMGLPKNGEDLPSEGHLYIIKPVDI